MSNQKDSKKIPAVRTYAMDLENRRLEEGLPPEMKETETTAPVKKVVKPAVSAPKKYFEDHPTPAVPSPMKKEEPVVRAIPKIVPKVNIEHVTKNTTFIVDNEDAAAATVITDRKHDRFKFFPAIFDSLKKWFENKKENYAGRKHPKYQIPESSRRKGVIQKATSASGKLTTADFSSIQDRIRQRNEEAMEDEDAPSTTWTANTEPGYLLLDGDNKTRVSNIAMVPRKSFRKVSEPAASEPLVVPTPVIEPIVVEKEIVPVVEEVEPVTEIEEPEPIAEVVETPEPPRRVVASVEVEEKTIPARFKFLLINTNILAVGVSGLVVALMVVAAVGYFRLNTFTENNPQPFFTKSFTEIIAAPYEEVKAASVDNPSYLSALATAKNRREEATQIVITDKSGSHISTQNTLFVLQIPPEQNFKQSISEIRFGYAADSSPFMLIQAKDKTVALGGLLSWETTLHRDFNRTFSVQSFIEDGKFIDGTIGGNDIRVLKSEAGAEMLIYGSVGDIVIITTDSVHFSELVDLIK